ncbi:spermatogenesis-associated protein 7 [Mantella aurantiaca]
MSGGDRRGGAASGVTSIPRCGVSSPFRGHLSTKSNAFSIGPSSRLSDQYRIRDHMLAHYNKILTAKAAVDSSAPKSLTKSIKYTDQQRREKLKTAVTRIERDPSRSPRPASRESSGSASQQKDLYDGFGNAFRRSPYSDPGVSPTSFLSSPRRLHSSENSAHFRRRHPDQSGASSRMGGGLSAWGTNTAAVRKFQDNRQKTYSGDLIEKHAHHFTGRQRPFTPRTLKTPAKPTLTQSRYYTAPRRRRSQTDLSSFRDRREAENGSRPLDGEEVEDPENFLVSEEEEEDSAHHRLSASRMSDHESPSPALQRIRSEEEELAYLGFVADVTNEILSLGLFSDRILDRVCERHIEENRHHLDQRKMHHLLDILRADLDSKDDKKLNIFVDHNFGSNRHFRDPLILPHTTKNDGFRSRCFSLEDYKSNLRFLDGMDDESQLPGKIRSILDGEDHPGPSGSLTCLDQRDLDNRNVLSGQEDFEETQRPPETAISLPEDEPETSPQKDDVLSLQDEETYSESQDITELSEKRSPVDDVLPEDHHGNQKSFSSTSLTDRPELDHDSKTSPEPRNLEDLEQSFSEKRSPVEDVLPEDHDGNQRSFSRTGLTDRPEQDHELKTSPELRDLEDLEQSFSEIIQVSKAEDGSVHEEETENVTSDRQDLCDQDDF